MPHSPPVYDWGGHGLVAVGTSIYNIGGSRSSNTVVSVLDCTSHTWSEAPNLSVKLVTLTASVVDRKIYVAGSYEDGDPHAFRSSIVEVLDTKTLIWDSLPIPWSKRKCDFRYKSTCIDGKFHLQNGSEERRWDPVGPIRMYDFMSPDTYCEIENVLYFGDRVFAWYDTKLRWWRKLMGLEGLPKFPQGACVRLANYGGKMAVLWDEDLHYRGIFHEKRIWCAEIALERFEWFGHVLSIPDICSVVKVVAATV